MDKLGKNDFLSCLPTAVQNAFKVQFATDLSTKWSGDTPDSLVNVEILSKLDLRSSKVSGTLILLFPKIIFLGIANRLFGTEDKEISDSNADLASEMLNITYASARTTVNKAGFDFQPAIPVVIQGQNLSLKSEQGTNTSRLICNCDFGPFFLDLRLKAPK